MKLLFSLLQSRKFLITLIGFVVATVLFGRGQITPAQFTDAIIALVGVLVVAIAIEDHGLKSGIRK